MLIARCIRVTGPAMPGAGNRQSAPGGVGLALGGHTSHGQRRPYLWVPIPGQGAT